ncbi:hypothetical protein V8E54_013676 [Elaphomyces granulatus]
MVEDEINNGKSGLFARVTKEFPGDFHGSRPNANFMKASRWWNIRVSTLAIPEASSNCISVNYRQPGREKKLLSGVSYRTDEKSGSSGYKNDEPKHQFDHKSGCLR